MEDRDNKKNPGALVVLVVGLLIVALYAGYWLFLFFGFDAADKEGNLVGVRSGTFGDAFGVLNALFSGLAFFGLITTLLLQRKDIADSQVDSLRQQAESQFYNMLNLQQSVVYDIDLQRTSNGGNQVITKGRDCFKVWSGKLQKEYDDATSIDDSDRIREAYRELWDKHRGDLSIYFRSLYTLLRFISESRYVNKKTLGSVARSLISDYELVILFYNCLMPSGERFQKYANEFAIFDNLDVTLLLNPSHVLQLDREAFGENEFVINIFDYNEAEFND
ncbi:putative phage abortive infection protein [Pseudomonas sp. MSSRFD41]|uniref:putative phage abortive infection protein n=1 Tax=Pseudomonas sp. MSSRFD41 TaxID=1310370 RepID=UPI00163A6DA6|nr:putative phage abortive infection protein [Pseudomonas sp. MSSRFD41]MBC2658598.1 putative phage abortive infection protein [Pseudomonas sp. MSSRFD41]